MIHNKIIANLLKECVECFVRKDFKQIEKRGFSGRLSIEEIKNAIYSFPGKISMPPSYAFNNFDKYDYEIKESEKEKALCFIEFNLWFDGDESDLTLSSEIIENNKGEYLLKIEDIHVL